MSERTPHCLRTFLSALMTCLFVILAVGSIALFLAPCCTVAKTTGWSFLGITKDSWTTVSVLAGVLAIVLGIVRVALAWDHLDLPLVQRKATTEWLAAIVVGCVLVAGAVTNVTPFSCVGRWREARLHPHDVVGAHDMCGCGGHEHFGGACCEQSTVEIADDSRQKTDSGGDAANAYPTRDDPNACETNP
jgi:hypothetical protein